MRADLDGKMRDAEREKKSLNTKRRNSERKEQEIARVWDTKFSKHSRRHKDAESQRFGPQLPVPQAQKSAHFSRLLFIHHSILPSSSTSAPLLAHMFVAFSFFFHTTHAFDGAILHPRAHTQTSFSTALEQGLGMGKGGRLIPRDIYMYYAN